jgi:hypothetical protein
MVPADPDKVIVVDPPEQIVEGEAEAVPPTAVLLMVTYP